MASFDFQMNSQIEIGLELKSAMLLGTASSYFDLKMEAQMEIELKVHLLELPTE